MERRGTTLKDVAEKAGVSKSTASAVLSGKHPNVRVSEATRGRILEAVRHLDYRPNSIARSLRRQSAATLGFYNGPGPLHREVPFFAEVLSGIQQCCAANCQRLLLLSNRDTDIDRLYDEVMSGAIDGLITYTPSDDPLIIRLVASGLPIVTIADDLPSTPSALADDTAGARRMFEYLDAKGHERFLLGDPGFMTASTRRRAAAFRAAAAALGRDIITTPHTEWKYWGESGVETWLSLPLAKRPTAAFCTVDIEAYLLLDACYRHGIVVPDDLAIAGFDGLPPAGAFRSLTTIYADWARIARTAVDLALKRIQGETVPLQTVIPHEFIVGDTA